MLIEFTKKDPRAGMQVALEDNVAQRLIDAGSAKAVTGAKADAEPVADAEPAPAPRKPAKKAAK